MCVTRKTFLKGCNCGSILPGSHSSLSSRKILASLVQGYDCVVLQPFSIVLALSEEVFELLPSGLG